MQPFSMSGTHHKQQQLTRQETPNSVGIGRITRDTVDDVDDDDDGDDGDDGGGGDTEHDVEDEKVEDDHAEEEGGK